MNREDEISQFWIWLFVWAIISFVLCIIFIPLMDKVPKTCTPSQEYAQYRETVDIAMWEINNSLQVVADICNTK